MFILYVRGYLLQIYSHAMCASNY